MERTTEYASKVRNLSPLVWLGLQGAWTNSFAEVLVCWSHCF